MRRSSWSVCALAIVSAIAGPVALAASETVASGSGKSPALRGDTWASVAQLPDWRGAWGLDAPSFRKGVQIATGVDPARPNKAPLTPKYEAMRLANGAANNGRGPDTGVINNSATCIPNGMPGLMQAPFAFEFVFAPGMVYVMPENNSIRRIFTDGRPHPADPDQTFNGHSIGHWEGDTLVVDTVGMSRRAEYFMGLKTSGKHRVVERMFRKDAETFQIDTVVHDDEAFTEPFRYTKTYTLSKRGMMEYVCLENNRDSNDFIDLTPPPEDE
jgi:hypothetical protein